MAKLYIDFETRKFVRKLRAIVKLAEQLADELDAIDDSCYCGSTDFVETRQLSENAIERRCTNCGEVYVVLEDDLPKPEVSE